VVNIKAQGKVSPPSRRMIRLPSTTLRVGRYIKGRGVK